MHQIVLTPAEIEKIRELQQTIVTTYSSAEDPALHHQLAILAQELPLRIRSFLNDFRLAEVPRGICLIAGLPVDDGRIGPTPAHWMDRVDRERTFPEQAFLLLAAALLGEGFGWSSLQEGRLVTDIFPIQKFADTQLGTSSRQPLYWHTEDAFHAHRADYLGLLGLRNADQTSTLIASIDQVTLVPEHVKVLGEARFLIFPDSSHLELNQVTTAASTDGAAQRTREHLHKMQNEPERVAVLFGDPSSPYLRIDPLMMQTVPGDDAGARALAWLSEALNAALFEAKIQPGELLFIDNFRAIHGRSAFAARFDGTDRWLKRVLVTRNLRASRQLRATALSRIVL